MRNRSILFLIAAAVFAAATASCEKNDDPIVEPEPRTMIVTFEGAALPDEGYLLDETYAESNMVFDHNYENWGVYFSWDGFAVSSKNDSETPGYDNQFSVYGGGGVDGSSQFAVCYVSDDTGFTFEDGSRRIKYAYIANSTWVYYSIKDGDSMTDPFASGDYFKLTATGLDESGAETGSADLYLADYRDGKTAILTEWTKFDLSSLGSVERVVFSLTTTKTNSYGPLTPSYFCIDNIAYYE